MHYVTRPSGRGLCLPDTRARFECTKEQTAMRNGSTRQAHRSDTNGCLCRRRARRSAALPATYLGAVLHPCTRPATTTQEARSCTHRYPSRHGSPRRLRLHTRRHARHWSARTRRARRVRSPQHARPAPPTTCDPTTRHDGTRSPGRVTRQPAPRGPAPGRPCSRSHRTRTGQMPLEGSGQARDSVASTLHCKMDKRTHSDRVLY